MGVRQSWFHLCAAHSMAQVSARIEIPEGSVHGGRMGKKNHSGLAAMVQLFGRLLDGHVLTAKVVANVLQIQEAAARRHLHRLAELPGAIKEKRGNSFGVKLPTLAKEPAPHSFDVVAGCLLSSLGGALRNTKFQRHAENLRARLLARSAKYCEAQHVDRKFWFVTRGGEKALPGRDADLVEIVEALLESRWIRFSYRNANSEVTEKRLRPLTLALYEQQFYVLGFYADSEVLRPFRFARMSRVKAEGKFDYPNAYSPDNVFKHSFGIYVDPGTDPEVVRVKVDGELREHAASHHWHPSQRSADDDTLELLVKICPEVTRWILWLGPDGEVVAPPTLRADVRDRLQRALARYGRKPGVARARSPQDQGHKRGQVPRARGRT